jgi:hypothetical protein
MKKALLLAAACSVLFCDCRKSDSNSNNTTGSYSGTGSLSQGTGIVTINSLYSCSGGRTTAAGTITSSDGKVWTVPAATNFATANKLPDLYNQCNGVTPASIAAVDTNSVPVTTIDPDGEIITGYIYADNYFELYVNGKLVGVDPVPYTPFNSCYVKFRAKRPIKYAIKLVDWEENLGTGTENNGGDPYHAGDGGFIASFSDGTVTSTAWKAQTFYIAPLAAPTCVTELGTTRLSTSCGTTGSATAYALHWEVPANWYESNFDFSDWPAATDYSEAAVGPKEAYSNFKTQFNGAQFIWSTNLVLDNLIILRFNGN